MQATTELAAGDWAAAEATARWVLAQPGGRGITGVHALATVARLHVRRGEADEATSIVREMWEVAETCGLLHHVAPAATALAEHAELTGEWDPRCRRCAARTRWRDGWACPGGRRGRLLVVPGG